MRFVFRLTAHRAAALCMLVLLVGSASSLATSIEGQVAILGDGTGWIVRSLSFSEDGSRLLVACAGASSDLEAVGEHTAAHGRIWVWSVSGNGVARALAAYELEGQLEDACFTGSSAKVAAIETRDARTHFLRWDLSTGHLEKDSSLGAQAWPPLAFAGFDLRAIALSPDGERAAIYAQGGSRITMWQTDPARQEFLVTAPEDVMALTLSERSASVPTLVITGWSSTAVLSVSSKNLLGATAGSFLGTRAAISPDGSLAAAPSASGVLLVETRTGASRGTLGIDSYCAAAFSTSGKYVAGLGSSRLVIWDAVSGETLYDGECKDAGPGSAVAFSPDASLLATAGTGGSVSLWDLDTLLQSHGGSTPAASSPGNPVGSSAGQTATGVVRFGQYQLREASLLKCASARGRPYTSIILSADGTQWMMLPDVLLDSGADTSFFPAVVAEGLGIDLSTCPTGTSSGVGGTTTTYYAEVYIGVVHMGGVEADVDGYILASGGEPLIIKTVAAFSEDAANADTYLLGRRDVFDSLTLTFKGDTATLTPASP